MNNETKMNARKARNERAEQKEKRTASKKMREIDRFNSEKAVVVVAEDWSTDGGEMRAEFPFLIFYIFRSFIPLFPQ